MSDKVKLVGSKLEFSDDQIKESFLTFVKQFGPNIVQFLQQESNKKGLTIDPTIKILKGDIKVLSLDKDKGLVLGFDGKSFSSLDYKKVKEEAYYLSQTMSGLGLYIKGASDNPDTYIGSGGSLQDVISEIGRREEEKVKMLESKNTLAVQDAEVVGEVKPETKVVNLNGE